MEVAGPIAMFARPDTGCAPTSYPAPTLSAVKGMFESIALLADGAAWICPTKVEICRRVGEPGGCVNFQYYTTNYGGPCRKPDLFNKGTTSGGSSMQLYGTVLSDVCYRLHGLVVGNQWRETNNPKHHLQDLFIRRLKRGQCFRTPCLGWSEFVCTYWGAFRHGITEVDSTLNLEIPSMLWSVWDKPTAGAYQPEFRQNVRVNAGVLDFQGYDAPREWAIVDVEKEGGADAE
ncbi:TPA: CRISPR-associated protein Cas5 [Candidatus Sumerlaeota bacterium]|nr:CRISPR-associated protein Cas5 [Candidatus Sumerlaeota bacterium]